MTTNPALDADEYLDSLFAKQEAREAAAASMAEQFRESAQKADANAFAMWAPLVNDWERTRRQPVGVTTDLPKRYQTMAEVMAESLDFDHGPSETELMQLLLNVAYGSNLANAPAQARDLLRRMGDAFGRVHSEVAA
jgi:hypothetical protein